jgi:hypothetical protein
MRRPCAAALASCLAACGADRPSTPMADRARTSDGDRVEPDEVIADRTELVTRAVAGLQTGR